MRTFLPAVLFLVASGCGGRDAPAIVSAPTRLAPSGPTIAHPDYANWSRFPIGTTVIHRSVTERGQAQTISTETFRLSELNDGELVVERQNTTERNDGSYRAVNPPEPRRYKKAFSLPAGMTEDDFKKPSLNAKRTGEDTIDVLGTKYKTHVYQWKEHSEVGDMNVTVWYSDEMPGRLVKQQIVIPSTETTTTDTLIEVTIPKAVK